MQVDFVPMQKSNIIDKHNNKSSTVNTSCLYLLLLLLSCCSNALQGAEAVAVEGQHLTIPLIINLLLSHSNHLELNRIVIVVRFEPLLSIVKATTSTQSQSQSQQQRRNPTRIIFLFCRIRASSLSLSSKPTLVLIYVVQYYIHEERIGRVTTFSFSLFLVYLSIYLYSFYSL